MKRIEPVISAIDYSYETVSWRDGIEISVKKILDFYEYLAFVDKVSASCFDESGSYMPEIFDFAVRGCTVLLYSNMNMPKDLAKQYDLLYHTDVFHTILGMIDMTQYSIMMESLTKKVEYLRETGILAHKNKLDEAVRSIGTISSAIEDVFNGVNNEDLINMISAVNDGEIDEEKIVRAYARIGEPDEAE